MPILANENTPTGTLNQQENIYIEGGPDLYFGGVSKYSPDTNGYYWGITGTPAKPVYKVGCYENFQLADNTTVNEIRCDTVGVKGTIVRRNYLEASFDLKALLPLSELRHLLRWSSSLAVPASDGEYAGIGTINQQDYHKIYFSRIYDPDAGDWVSFTGHRCQFAWNGAIQMRYGDTWMVGVQARFYADETLPSDQQFATVVRFDASVF